MVVAGGFEVVRDPLWNNIGIDEQALAVLDTEPFQRLRYIRQLGHAFLVYPGATHTRFEHALGTYHLARRALLLLEERGHLANVPADEITLIRLAALLHDIGHYPFSHALEEAGLPSHEDLAHGHFTHPELTGALARTGIANAGDRLANLIVGQSETPLQGLISGALDLDKIEYLTRDAHMCGVPYGTVDVDRLLHSLTIVMWDGRKTVGLHEKGVSALESLLFAKYEMYRNVYWHHAVRSATVMFKRVVRSAIARGQIQPDWIAQSTDEALMEALRALHDAPIAGRLRRRRLYKRILDLSAGELAPGAGAWIAEDPDLLARVEDRLAAEAGVAPGDLLLDFPAKPEMLAGGIPILTRAGTVAPVRLGIEGVAEELHTAARRFRVYAATAVALDREGLRALAESSGEEMRNGLEQEKALLKR
ncbi:MAG: HD domain-containing protein [Gemmatimonadetes bacterium]|nr:HD domain-containing protein [Gemmatimonadota bacterium]